MVLGALTWYWGHSPLLPSRGQEMPRHRANTKG